MRVATQLSKLHRRHVDVNVDSIQKPSGDPSDVSLNLALDFGCSPTVMRADLVMLKNRLGSEDGAKMVAGRVDTKPAEAIP